jgi:DNA-3-methyladenine glycosylase I
MGKIRCSWANKNKFLADYHDNEYGLRINDDKLYFERLILELFQAGLSWETILKKRADFNRAFDGFDFYKIARYSTKKIDSLMNDPSIIRNRRKIDATIFNAKKFIEIVKEYSSFDKFMHTLPIADRDKVLKIFKHNFKFMGPLIVEEFMMSTGFWEVRHDEACFMFNKN